MVHSRYNRFEVRLTVIVCAFCLAGAFLLLFKHNSSAKDGLGAFLLMVFGIGGLIGFFNKTPRFFFDEEKIVVKTLFNRKEYLWNDVTNVLLTAQERYLIAFIFTYPMEAMKLELGDRAVLRFWGDMYSNMNELRNLVVQKLNGRLQFFSAPKTGRPIDSFFQKRYAGNVFTSFNTLLILGMFIFFLVGLKIKLGRELLLLVPIAFLAIMYCAFSTQMHYFEIANGELFIRNHFFPWTRKGYALADIEEAAKESPYRRSNGLRLLTYDFNSTLYCAGSLRGRHWKELMNDLSSFGIKTPDQST